MYKKLAIVGIVIYGMITIVSAATVRPDFVTPLYGQSPATWMALIAILFALIDNFGRAWDKSINNPEFKYNYAYLNATIVASALIGLTALGLNVTEFGLHEILNAVILGIGGNLSVKEATKGTR